MPPRHLSADASEEEEGYINVGVRVRPLMDGRGNSIAVAVDKQKAEVMTLRTHGVKVRVLRVILLARHPMPDQSYCSYYA